VSVYLLLSIGLATRMPTTVFLPDNAYFGEVVSCTRQRQPFTVQLILIQHRDNDA
jgi:hypothetical protein